MSRVLIVLDMQNDFLTGALGTAEARAIVPNVMKKIGEYLNADEPIIFVQDTHRQGYVHTDEGKRMLVAHCIRGTDGWKIPDILNIPNCLHIEKHSPGYPYWDISGLVNADLDGVDEIELVGLHTNMAVIANALIIKAIFPEMDVVVDQSCCAGTTPELHKSAIDVMKSSYITVVGDTKAVTTLD